ncbi:MAG: hypothetical protein HYR75_06080 [Gemmatimonadetes bacterium]|nr:hypothetical protein [Gemmatimonadota bacterium]MBI3566943.1 hypothetical protein [Gemmatimonadota bacterium]
MPRALSIQRSIVPAGERDKYLERLKTRRAHYERAGCKFWVFEEAALTGAFIEFTEASDAAKLAAAHAASPDRVLDPARIYTEVELS